MKITSTIVQKSIYIPLNATEEEESCTRKKVILTKKKRCLTFANHYHRLFRFIDAITTTVVFVSVFCICFYRNNIIL